MREHDRRQILRRLAHRQRQISGNVGPIRCVDADGLDLGQLPVLQLGPHEHDFVEPLRGLVKDVITAWIAVTASKNQ